jgi:hypothetical protein
LPNPYRIAIAEHDLRETNVTFLQYQVIPIIVLIVISIGLLGSSMLTARDWPIACRDSSIRAGSTAVRLLEASVTRPLAAATRSHPLDWRACLPNAMLAHAEKSEFCARDKLHPLNTESGRLVDVWQRPAGKLQRWLLGPA